MGKILKRMFAVLLCVVMAAGCLTGCKKEKSGGIVLNEENKGVDVPEGRKEVVFWTTYGSDSKSYIQGIIDSFNSSQSTYFVTLQYVGTRDDLYAKMQVSEKKNLPALINTTTEMTGAFMYSDWITPVYKLAGEEDKQYLERIYGNLSATWSDAKGNLLGYPMGNSMSGIFLNMDIMKAAGIDPYRDIKTVSDLYKVSKKLKDGGFVKKKAIGFEHTARVLNYSLAMEGVDIYDNNNGLKSAPTKCYYNSSPVKELVEEFFKTYKKMKDENLAYTMGASWGNELLPAYAVGDIAILTGTIGGYGRLERAWKDASEKPINTVFIPWVPIRPETTEYGQCASGNGFYVVNNDDNDSQKGAWEFIKYFTSGDNFAGWCTLTGYLPIADDILETNTYKRYMEDNKNLGLDYLMEVQRKDNGKTFHPISAIYTNTSTIGLDKFNKYLDGENINNILPEWETEINDEFQMWNMTNGY